MRRKDREVTNQNEIIDIIEKCDVCRLALSENNIPYVIPMNFGYTFDEDKLILYFHCAKEGKKLDIIRQNPNACFEMDCSHKVTKGPEACDYSMSFESVIGNGIITFCTEKSEKILALRQLMKTYEKGRAFTFPDAAVDAVTILKLEVNEFTGKRHL